MLLNGVKMKGTVYLYNKCKYDEVARVIVRVPYNNIQSVEETTGKRAIETDENSRDPFNEYLVINFENGETLTFCNSHVDYMLF